MRINRASDDAAGLSVSSTLKVNSRVFNRARLNLGDAISMLNMADGALEQVSTLLTRMSELATQSANGSFSKVQRKSIDEEFQALDQELRRIALSTKFNKQELFDGTIESGTDLTVQLSTNATTSGVSLDGNYVAFNDGGDLKVYDKSTGTTVDIDSASGIDAAAGQAFITVDNKVIFKEFSFGANTDLYSYDLDTGTVERLVEVNSNNFTVSADGSTLAFFSDNIYADGGTTDDIVGSGTNVLSVLDLETGKVKSVSQSDTGRSAADQIVISADGTKIGVETSSDLTGGNSDLSTEFFVVDVGTGPLEYRQASNFTAGQDFNFAAGITNDGRIFFSSSTDFVGQAQGARQIFELNTNTSVIRQLTDFDTSGNYNMANENIGMRPDGTGVFFVTGKDLTGEKEGEDTRRVFELNLLSGEIELLSNANPGTSFVDGIYYSGDGSTAIGQSASGASTVLLYDLRRGGKTLDFEAGFGAEGRVAFDLGALFSELKMLGASSITSQTGARAAIDNLSENLAAIASLRGVLGANLSRLDTALNQVASQQLQSEAANARIENADISEESAALVRTSILRQASSAVLAQANLQPELAIRLLS